MVENKTVARLQRGMPPENGKLITSNDEWSLYLRNRVPGFFNIKVCAHAPRKKANFWLGYDIARKRIVNNADGKKIQREYSLLCAWVLEHMATVV